MKKYTKEELEFIENLDEYLVTEIKKINPKFKKVTEEDYLQLRSKAQAKTPDFERELEIKTCNIAFDFLKKSFIIKQCEISPMYFDDSLSQCYLFTREFLKENGTKLPETLQEYAKNVCHYIKTSFKAYEAESKEKNADLNYKHVEHEVDYIFDNFHGFAEKPAKPADVQNFELAK